MKTERTFYQIQAKHQDQTSGNDAYGAFMVWDGYDYSPLEDENLDKLIKQYTDEYYTDLKQEMRIAKIHEKIEWDVEVVAFPEYSVCCHPDHKEGHDCLDRAVGCDKHCRCCMGELAVPLS